MANFVETELVLKCGSHVVSYVIIRGSVPVYWSQHGNKYRPVPVIEKSESLAMGLCVCVCVHAYSRYVVCTCISRYI